MNKNINIIINKIRIISICQFLILKLMQYYLIALMNKIKSKMIKWKLYQIFLQKNNNNKMKKRIKTTFSLISSIK